ncbi:MAG: hypothetical protein ABIS10_08795 [Novosphingobium sp.]
MAFGTALPDGLGAAAGVAEVEGVGLPPMLHGLGLDVALAPAAASGPVAPLPQPAKVAAKDAASSKTIGFFIIGFLKHGACTTCRKAFANRSEVCPSADEL